MEDYDARVARLRKLGVKIEDVLRDVLDTEKVRTHSIEHRVKDKPSLARKLEAKQPQYQSLDDVHDLLGVRVITYFPDEVDRVARIVEREFAIDAANSIDQRAVLDPDRFGYLSFHYVATLSSMRSDLTELRGFRDVKFEIQIRSILQHAWAEIEHDLGYKTEQAIPRALRRRFSRLAGMLEMADSEFQSLRDSVANYQATVEEEIAREPESVDINRESVASIIRTNREIAELDELFSSLTGATIEEMSESYSQGLSENLSGAGLRSIAEVENRLRSEKAILSAFMRRKLGPATTPSVPSGVGLFHLAYVVVAARGSVEELVTYLMTFGIGHGSRARLARELLDAYEAAVKDVGQ